jgi:hypothetical protein
MKIHKGMVNARVVTQVTAHYRHAVYQTQDATGTLPAFGVQHVMPARAVNTIHIPTATESARKCKLVKSGGKLVRRVTYR